MDSGDVILILLLAAIGRVLWAIGLALWAVGRVVDAVGELFEAVNCGLRGWDDVEGD